jgi:hypothetical protein
MDSRQGNVKLLAWPLEPVRHFVALAMRIAFSNTGSLFLFLSDVHSSSAGEPIKNNKLT